jgi:membrane protease YdiL (CAAX protease family)
VPVGQVAVFAAAFLLLSLLAAVPVALATGRMVLGIWYILPFTLVFVILYQRLRHREGLRHLGLDPRARWGRLVGVGFAGSGVVVAGVETAHVSFGWMDVTAFNPALGDLPLAAAGVGLALLLNLGIGVGEELIFRGYVLHRLLCGYRTAVPGVVLSALAYAAVHAASGRQLPTLLNLFLLGVVLALAVVLTRSLWLAIGIHMGWDFWIDGVYFYQGPDFEVSRLLVYQYHLAGTGDLIAFKLVNTTALLLVSLGLAMTIRRRRTETKLMEAGR